MENKKLVFIVNVDWFFISHRIPIALEAIQQGYDVHIICKDTGHMNDLLKHGLSVHDLDFSRSGSGLFHELSTLFRLRHILNKIEADIIHAVTIKPVLYSGIVINTLKIKPKFVAAISGLGYVFSANDIRARLTKSVVSVLYKIAFFNKKKSIIFQNTTDESIISSIVNLSNREKKLIKGSGADLSVYKNSTEPKSDSINIVMACRLLKEKGVYEFINAAKIVHSKCKNVEFILAGTPDSDNPNSVTQNELDEWHRLGFIKAIGHCNNIPELFSNSHIVTMPSFYGEGVPKVLIEAAACGRPVVTTNSPGCRDSIIPNESGLLVPIRDANALASAFIELINNQDLRILMGEKARIYAESEFDLKSVVSKHMKIYEELLEL
ncbi:glycosyltransferase family 4 protein [Photobacterium leiognathi]|uniref:glycosyltransferase family 4 protein n=1 Tax=Photobacterium leiognathi TaxID=553611 RepID=UPI0029825071|nr:glycosyltransferase family 4 protein [Photobacterium leiognathi]